MKSISKVVINNKGRFLFTEKEHIDYELIGTLPLNEEQWSQIVQHWDFPVDEWQDYTDNNKGFNNAKASGLSLMIQNLIPAHEKLNVYKL
jgi:hypothetical protein